MPIDYTAYSIPEECVKSHWKEYGAIGAKPGEAVDYLFCFKHPRIVEDGAPYRTQPTFGWKPGEGIEGKASLTEMYLYALLPKSTNVNQLFHLIDKCARFGNTFSDSGAWVELEALVKNAFNSIAEMEPYESQNAIMHVIKSQQIAINSARRKQELPEDQSLFNQAVVDFQANIEKTEEERRTKKSATRVKHSDAQLENYAELHEAAKARLIDDLKSYVAQLQSQDHSRA